jgi:hypothetical protein
MNINIKVQSPFLFQSLTFGMDCTERRNETLRILFGTTLGISRVNIFENFLTLSTDINKWLRKSLLKQMYTMRLVAELQQKHTNRYGNQDPVFIILLYDNNKIVLGPAIIKTSTEVIIRVIKTSLSSFFMSACLPNRSAPLYVKMFRMKAKMGKIMTMVELKLL